MTDGGFLFLEKKMSINNQKYTRAINACFKNGRRLLDEAEMLEFEDPVATKYFLSIIAQEEFAKAFLLYLVKLEVIPWNKFIYRATRDHCCKQLVGIIIDFLAPDDDLFLKRMYDSILRKIPSTLPKKVADAINILRHEKIRRWELANWFWDEDPDYEKEVESIASGRIDKKKQDAIYISLGKDGAVANTPDNIDKKEVCREYERARRFEGFVKDLCKDQKPVRIDYEQVENVLKVLFSSERYFMYGA